MATVTPQQVTARAAALRQRDTGLRAPAVVPAGL